MVSRITSKFDSNRTKEYKLSILVSQDGFSFSVVHPLKNRILAFYEEKINLSSIHFIGRRFEEWLDSQGILQNNFAEINLYYNSGKYTPAPSEFYDYENQNALINLLHGSDKACETRDNYIPEISANLIFTVPISLIEAFQNHFPGIPVQHPLSGFIASTVQNIDSEINLSSLIINESSFDLLLFSKGSLLAVNHFKSVIPDDVAYFLFSVIKYHNISAENLKIELAGSITEENKIFNALHKLFKNIRLKDISVNYDFEVFGTFPRIHTPFY
jgi:hypothetical protein